MASTEKDTNGQSSSDKKKLLLFYKKQIICESDMDRLKERSEELLNDMKQSSDKLDAFASDAASCHKDKLSKCLAKAKSRQSKNILVEDFIIDEDDGGFIIDKLYDNWHNVIINSAKLQHKNAKNLADNWFEALENIGIEDAFEVKEKSNKNEEEPTDAFEVKEKSNKNEEEPTDAIVSNTTWFVLLVSICAGASLFFYNSADINECVNDYSECLQNIAVKLLLKIYEYYTEFHGITTENEQEL